MYTGTQQQRNRVRTVQQHMQGHLPALSFPPASWAWPPTQCPASWLLCPGRTWHCSSPSSSVWMLPASSYGCLCWSQRNCILGSSRSKVEFADGSEDSKEDMSAWHKLVLGTASPDEAVKTLIWILSLACNTPTEQLDICQPLIDRQQIGVELLKIQRNVDQRVGSRYLVLSKGCLEETPWICTHRAQFMAWLAVSGVAVVEWSHHCLLHLLCWTALSDGSVVVNGQLADCFLR